MDVVKVGFIGCGGNARGHMRSVKQLPNAQIVATCDFVEELAKSAANEFGGKPYTSMRTMLEKESLDAVYISIPVHAHGEPERVVIEAGLPFLVEKPVARRMEIAEEIAALVAEKNLTTCVGYQLRYCGTVSRAREILADKTIGMIVGRYWCGSGWSNPDRWVVQMEKSGGRILEQATHTIDMMRYLGGEIAEVYAKQANRAIKRIDCPDMNAVVFEFKSGAVGALTTTWAFEPSDWSLANLVDVLYERAVMMWSSKSLRVKREKELIEYSNVPGGSIDATFVSAVQTGDASGILSTYADAVKTLRVCLAINESGAEGVPKKL